MGVVMKQNAALAFVMRHHNSYLTRTHLHPISFFISSFSLSLLYFRVFLIYFPDHIPLKMDRVDRYKQLGGGGIAFEWIERNRGCHVVAWI